MIKLHLKRVTAERSQLPVAGQDITITTGHRDREGVLVKIRAKTITRSEPDVLCTAVNAFGIKIVPGQETPLEKVEPVTDPKSARSQVTALQQLELFPINGPTDGSPTIEFARLFIDQLHGSSTFTMANGNLPAQQEAFIYWSGILDDSQQAALQ